MERSSILILLTICQQTCMTYTYCCVYSEKHLMMNRGTAPNIVEFYSKNKLEKLVHLVGFITRIFCSLY